MLASVERQQFPGSTDLFPGYSAVCSATGIRPQRIDLNCIFWDETELFARKSKKFPVNREFRSQPPAWAWGWLTLPGLVDHVAGALAHPQPF
jgi:hypothetical protein